MPLAGNSLLVLVREEEQVQRLDLSSLGDFDLAGFAGIIRKTTPSAAAQGESNF